MTEVIHHNDSSNTSMVVVVILALAILGFLLWYFLPARGTDTNNDGVDIIDINLPPAPSPSPTP